MSHNPSSPLPLTHQGVQPNPTAPLITAQNTSILVDPSEEVRRLASKVLKSQTEEAKASAQPQATTNAQIAVKEAQARSHLAIDTHAEAFLKMAVAQDVSDIHIRVGYPPIFRFNGEMMFTKMGTVTEEQVMAFLHKFVSEEIKAQLDSKMDLDFSFEVQGLARFRVSYLHEMDNPALVLRVVKMKIPEFTDLGLPPILLNFTKMSKGLVLVTGPTGSGKTTSLAAMLNHLNRYQSQHVITLEDPIEFVYKNERSVFTQRQLGIDTASFAAGIKYALRQDPDTILVGEMRDRETIQAALHAAETGHMVFSTLHTIDAVQTIGRIINQFEPHERETVRLQLASVLAGTISQRLARRLDGRGRVPITEIMFVTSTVKDYIEKNQIEDIYQLMSDSKNDELVSMNKCLFEAYNAKKISYDEALEISEQPHELGMMLKGVYGSAEDEFYG
ncbi:MAG: PilT/PilU family type 4a pilus ATPase [Vampirovibrionales bacterium]|jgi:twitching motility protein PilT|nr:PilT/PilU family type 4a pilus ATPase [Vampirovibrionales bacterium]